MLKRKARSFREKFKRGPFGNKTNATSNQGSTISRTVSISGRDDKSRGSIRGSTPDKEPDPSGRAIRPTVLAEDKTQLIMEPMHPVGVL